MNGKRERPAASTRARQIIVELLDIESFSAAWGRFSEIERAEFRDVLDYQLKEERREVALKIAQDV